MIAINLLPPEYRPVERTPLPRRLTIFVGVLLTCIGSAICAWLMFVKVPEAKTERDSAQQQVVKKASEAQEVLNKESEFLNLEVRANILRGLYKQRLPWSKLLDRLADARGKVDLVVLTGLELRRGPATGPVVAGRPREVSQLGVKGLVVWYEANPQSDELRKIYLRFIDALRNDKAFADMFDGEPQLKGDRMIESLGSTASARGERVPKAGLEFEVVFTFKPPSAAAGSAATGKP